MQYYDEPYCHKDLSKKINLYLDLIVSQLASKSQVDIQSENWVSPDKIFSFNYTNTYQRIHDSLPVEYLHGSHGEFQNIVLGVSEIEGVIDGVIVVVGDTVGV